MSVLAKNHMKRIYRMKYAYLYVPINASLARLKMETNYKM